MNPNNNDDNQNPQNDVQQPQQPVVDEPSTGVPSVTPGGKETAPMPTAVGEVSDYIEPAAHETAPQLESAVEDAGVQLSQNGEELRVTDEHKAAGIEPAKEATPLPMNAQAVIGSPWPLEKAEKEAGGKADHGSTWLGSLIVLGFKTLPFREKHREEAEAA